MGADAEVIVNTRLANVRQFIAGAQAEAGAIREIGTASMLTGEKMAITTRRSWLMNQALFTLRRVVYGTTLGMLAGGAAALKWGNDYNTAMQGARVALRPFFNNNQELESSLNRLWTIAKYSPFQIKDMTLAFSRLYPAMSRLGITAPEVTTTLKNLTDALSVGMAGRVTPAALNRASVALQHLAFLGRLTGMSVLQLARDGIPIYAALQKELGLTGDQMHNIGKLGIPASVALKAINDYISSTPGYANAAYRLSVKSVSGLFSTFKDNISKTFGLAERGWFAHLQKTLTNMNNWFNRLNAELTKTHSLIQALNNTVTPRSNRVIFFWRLFKGALHDAWVVVRALTKAFTDNRALLYEVVTVLVLLRGILYAAAHTTMLWLPGLQTLLAIMFLWKAYTIGATIWNWAFVTSLEAETGAVIRLSAWQRLVNLYKAIGIGITILATAATWAWTAANEAAAWVVTQLTIQMWALNLAIASNPIYFLIAAAVLLIAGLVILYFKWKWFHDAVNKTAKFLYNHWYILALVPVVGPFVAGIVLMVRHLHDLEDAFGRVYRVGQNLHELLSNPIGYGGGSKASFWDQFLSVTTFHLLGKQAVGSPGVARSGPYMVGERGPEIVHLPFGSRVTPMGMAGGAGAVLPEIVVPVTLKLDGQRVARIVARHQTDVNARA